MDRKTFLHRFGMGVGAIILAPEIIRSSIIKPDNEIIAPSKGSALLGNEIFIRVINNNSTPAEIMLFGANKSIIGNFVPEGIKLFIAGYSMQQLNDAIMDNPVRIVGFRMRVKSPSQLGNTINLYHEEKNGRLERRIFQPLFYRSPRGSDITAIDAPTFELLLTPEVYITNEINPGEQVDYIFTIEKHYTVYRNKPIILHS